MICGMRKVLVVALLSLLTLGATPAAAACAGANQKVTRANIREARAAIRCLINARRAAVGVDPLKTSRKLTLIARRHAKLMRDEDFFGHTTPDGRTREQRYADAGYHHRTGENLAFGWETPRIVVRRWMRPGDIHTRNILSERWRYLGVGAAVGSSRKRLYAVAFGPARA